MSKTITKNLKSDILDNLHSLKQTILAILSDDPEYVDGCHYMADLIWAGDSTITELIAIWNDDLVDREFFIKLTNAWNSFSNPNKNTKSYDQTILVNELFDTMHKIEMLLFHSNKYVK